MTSENTSPAVSDASPISLRVGHPVTLDVKGRFLDADGDPLSFSVAGLPSGLMLNTAQQISGRPSLAGTYGVNFVLDDGVAQSTQTIQFDVKENNPPVQSSTTPVNATTAQGIAIDLTRYFSDQDSDALTFSVAGLPSGLALQGSSIAGAVATEWSGNISVVAFDGYDRASGIIALTVTKPTPPSSDGGGGGGGSAALLCLLAALASQRGRNGNLGIFNRHKA